MDTRGLIDNIAYRNEFSPAKAGMIFNIILNGIIDKIKNGGSVSIKNFGTFEVSEYGISFTPDSGFLNLINS